MDDLDREIQQMILELLAADAGRDPEALAAELALGGEEMPIDSVLGAAVLARLEQRYGVSLPASAETAPALRSVRAFAAAIRSLIEAELPRQAQGA